MADLCSLKQTPKEKMGVRSAFLGNLSRDALRVEGCSLKQNC